jgi:transposase
MRRLRRRGLTDEERTTVERLAPSRTAPVRQVERARIVWPASQGQAVPGIADRLRLRACLVRGWIHRFNAAGLDGLEDRPRAGRPPTYAPEQVATVTATALTDPKALDLPFASWTLDRLAAHPNEHQGIAIKRSRIDAIRLAAGLRWRKHATWFGERVDPAGQAIVETRHHAGRAKHEIGYGRRGKGYVFGAFCPATGEAFTRPYLARRTASRVAFLEEAESWLPAEAARAYAVLGDLSSHRATDLLLFMLAHPRWARVFQPKYAAYLHRFEPWWKILRSLALKGRRFETWEEIVQAVGRATACWNAHRHPFVRGRRRRHQPRRQPGIALPPKTARLAG